jgi:hypothetical protein
MNNPLFFNQFMQRVQQLKAQIGGDPNKQIQQMLNSGKITQEDYNKAVERANQLRKMFGM